MELVQRARAAEVTRESPVSANRRFVEELINDLKPLESRAAVQERRGGLRWIEETIAELKSL